MKTNKEGFFITVNLDNKEVEKDMTKVLEDYEIDEPYSITEAMRKQPGKFLKWASLLNAAKNVKIAIDREHSVWYADKRVSAEKKLKEDTGKKPTISDIENGIIRFCPNGCKKWNNKIDKAKETVETFEIIVKALIMKKEMLMSVGQLCSRLIDSGNLVVKEKKITGGK